MDNNDKQLMLMLIWLFIQHGRDDKALVLCRELYTEFNEDFPCCCVFARLLLQDGRPQEALAVLNKSPRPADNRAERIFALLMSRALLDSGKENEAKIYWQNYLSKQSRLEAEA